MLFSLHRKVKKKKWFLTVNRHVKYLTIIFLPLGINIGYKEILVTLFCVLAPFFFPFFFFFEKDKINQNKAIRRIRTEWNTRNRYPQPPPLLLLQMAKSDLSVIVFCIKDNWYVTRNRWFFIFCWHNSLAQLVYTYYKLVL